MADKDKDNAAVAPVKPGGNPLKNSDLPKTEDDYLSQENINKFQDLLNRLQRSKMQQAQQGARESRKGTFAQGIASMMSNF